MNKIAKFFSLFFYCAVCFSSAATLFLFALQCCNPILGVFKLALWKRFFNNPELAVFTVKPFVVLGLLACIFITYVFKCYLTKQQRKILWLLMLPTAIEAFLYGIQFTMPGIIIFFILSAATAALCVYAIVVCKDFLQTEEETKEEEETD